MGLPGQAVGGAMADLLFGDAPPTGKLAETWPLKLSDCPSTRNFAPQHSRRQVARVRVRVIAIVRVRVRARVRLYTSCPSRQPYPYP